MSIFTGYYESSTKHTLKCALTRSLKTSPVTLFRVKNMIQCITKNRTFQKFESVLCWITMFRYEANRYNLYGITFCTTSLNGSGLITAGIIWQGRCAASLTFAFNPFLEHQTGLKWEMLHSLKHSIIAKIKYNQHKF